MFSNANLEIHLFVERFLWLAIQCKTKFNLDKLDDIGCQDLLFCMFFVGVDVPKTYVFIAGMAEPAKIQHPNNLREPQEQRLEVCSWTLSLIENRNTKRSFQQKIIGLQDLVGVGHRQHLTAAQTPVGRWGIRWPIDTAEDPAPLTCHLHPPVSCSFRKIINPLHLGIAAAGGSVSNGQEGLSGHIEQCHHLTRQVLLAQLELGTHLASRSIRHAPATLRAVSEIQAAGTETIPGF